MYRSQIRTSTINALLEKSAARDYGSYLSRVVLKHVRGFDDQSVSFDFPVTALIGPNGGGKTTILGAAACAYKSVQPKRFFAKSGKYDGAMQDWTIEYELIDRSMNMRDPIKRTASFKSFRWKRGALERNVLVFGVTRTVPANERSELARCARTTFSVPQEREEELTQAVADAISKILGKDLSGFKRISVDSAGRIVLLAGRTASGSDYSEFHFGAGESSITRMVAQIEQASPQSLVLIEEIENGLHPIATIRLVEYLIDAAQRKKIQCILTTHSNDALRPLPSKAIWVATQDRIFQGKLDIQSLRAITGQVEAKLVLFVEDEFSKQWVEATLRQARNIALDNIQVHAMQGDGTAVAINRYHNADPSTTTPSACYIDGDSRQSDNDSERVFRLPGQSPEAYVFDELMDSWSSFGGKLCVALLQRYEDVVRVKAILEEIRTTNRDPHLLYSQVGERLGLIPEATVATAFTNMWAQAYQTDAAQLIKPIKSLLPTDDSPA